MVHPVILDAESVTHNPLLPRMSEEEFVAWATDEVRAEWVNGEVILMSPAASRHVQITGWLHRVLGMYIDIKKLGELLGPELMVRLTHAGISRRILDLLFLSTAKLKALQPNHFEGAPDLAIEIVSPDSADRDWQDKFFEYEASGVSEYWIIDPITETFGASIQNSAGKFEKMELDVNGVLHSVTVSGFWLKPEWFWQPEFPDALQHLRKLGVL